MSHKSLPLKSLPLKSLPLYKSVYVAIFALLVLLMGATTPSYAAIDVYDFDSKRQEAQYRGLIDEFRCPKCQNQNLAGSDAPIAQDLKQKTYDMVKDGRSDAEIRQYMQERYGDFISYSPPVRPSTWVLWFFPPLLLIVVLGGWLWRNRGNRTRTIKPRSTVDSSLSAGEQEALDKLLASRMKSSVTEASVNSDEPKLSEVNATKSNSSKLKKNKSKTDKSKTDKRKSNNQARDKGDSL